MKNPRKGQKLVRLLGQLPPQERKAFQKYLLSPYFGKRPVAVRILQILEKSVLGKGLDYVPLELFAREIMPDKPMDAKKREYIRLRLVNLQEKALDFIALQRYQKAPEIRNRLLLEEAVDRGWEKFIPGFYEKGCKTLGEEDGSAPYLERLRLEESYNGYLAQRAIKGMDLHLDSVLKYSDLYYLLGKLKFATAAANLRWIWGEEREIRLLGPVLEEVERSFDTQPTLIKAYYHSYRMLSHARMGTALSQSHFEQLVDLIKAPMQASRSDANSLFLYAQNYCALQFHLGHRHFFARLKELYDYVLESGTVLEGGLLSPQFFKNTVNMMCRFGQLDWVERFVDEYGPRILGDEKRLAWIYNLGVLRFYQADYAGTIRILYPEVSQFEEVLYAIGARTYICRAFWMQEEWELLFHFLHAFRQFIQRKRDLPPGEKKNTRLFINYMGQMAKAMTLPGNQVRDQLLKIREEMHRSSDHLLLNWVYGTLLEKLGALS